MFIKAEVAARGWITDDATSVYVDAITASMEFWGVDGDAIDVYLVQPEVAYNDSNYRKTISEPKWVSLYMDGSEAWSEWRRLDYPELTSAPAEGRDIIRRREYYAKRIRLERRKCKSSCFSSGEDAWKTPYLVG